MERGRLLKRTLSRRTLLSLPHPESVFFRPQAIVQSHMADHSMINVSRKTVSLGLWIFAVEALKSYSALPC